MSYIKGVSETMGSCQLSEQGAKQGARRMNIPPDASDDTPRHVPQL